MSQKNRPLDLVDQAMEKRYCNPQFCHKRVVLTKAVVMIAGNIARVAVFCGRPFIQLQKAGNADSIAAFLTS